MRLLMIIIALSSLMACLPDAFSEGKNHKVQLKESALSVDDVLFDQSAEMLGSMWLLRSGQDFLSAKAQENLKKVMQNRASMRKHMMTICGLAPTLSAEDKRAISTIKSDQSLDNTERKAKIKALLNDRMKQSGLAINACKKDKQVEIAPYLAQRNFLKDACLITFKADDEIAGHPTRKARAWQRVKTLTKEEKGELNRRLESKNCDDALMQQQQPMT